MHTLHSPVMFLLSLLLSPVPERSFFVPPILSYFRELGRCAPLHVFCGARETTTDVPQSWSCLKTGPARAYKLLSYVVKKILN